MEIHTMADWRKDFDLQVSKTVAAKIIKSSVCAAEIDLHGFTPASWTVEDESDGILLFSYLAVSEGGQGELAMKVEMCTANEASTEVSVQLNSVDASNNVVVEMIHKLDALLETSLELSA